MAVRSAYALGMHREESMSELLYALDQKIIRRNVWKTLFILDRFLAASLGRPTAISEDDCSSKILPNGHLSIMAPPPSNGGMQPESAHGASMDACVWSCHVIGEILGIFANRKISTTMVQQIANRNKDWRNISNDNLRQHYNPRPRDPAEGIAKLHVDLFSLHSLILLTRQIFVMHTWKMEEQRSGLKKSHLNRDSPMAKWSEACVIASYHTLFLVRRVFDADYLPKRNPFIM